MNILRRKFRWAWICFLQAFFHYDPISGLNISPGKCLRIGRCGGGVWKVPAGLLQTGMRVLSAGMGEETSFEQELLGGYEAEVLALDPTPRASIHAESVTKEYSGFEFQAVGLWDEDGEQLFYAPADPHHVSHSIVGLQGEVPSFTAPCKRWQSVLSEKGWEQVDLFKMDIEGAEYRVLSDLLTSELHPPVICLEFDETHSPMDRDWKLRIRESVQKLQSHGYALAGIVPKGNYTFVKGEC